MPSLKPIGLVVLGIFLSGLIGQLAYRGSQAESGYGSQTESGYGTISKHAERVIHAFMGRYDMTPDLVSMETFDPAVAARLDYIAEMQRDRRVDCAALMQDKNNLDAILISDKVITDDQRKENEIYDRTFNKILKRETRSCSQFIANYGFIMDSLSQEEKNFPIAFSIIAHKTPEHVFRLLRAVYRPQNFYCIHIDKKNTTEDMFTSLEDVASCLPNVFMSSRRVTVEWGNWTVLETELICMSDLWKYKTWRYFINLTGQEFPLKNNYELVKILKAYKGANDVRGTHKYVILKRFRVRHRSGRLPLKLTSYKSPVHVAVNRDFVDFVLHDKRAQYLKRYLNGTIIPDESFFGIVNHNPQLGIHGSYIGQKEQELAHPERDYVNIKQSFIRHKIWDYYKKTADKCAGHFMRHICVLSKGDLPRLYKSPALIANKMKLHNDRVVITCLEELTMNKTRDYYRGTRQFNTSIYANSDIVKHRLVNDTEGKWNT